MAPPPRGGRLLSFSRFRLDLDAERLWKGDQEVHLRRKPFAILRHLVKNPQRLVTHDEIVVAVWGKVAMSESLLRTHVRDLRHVLGDGMVETVVGRGYRFVADLKRDDVGTTEGEAEAPAGVDAGRLMVGREAELDALRAALRSAKDRRRTTVFVTGDAGVGKTSLVDHFIELASEQGPLLVGRGACVEQYGSGQAFLPVLDALGSLCRGKGADRVLDVVAKHAPTWLLQMPSLVRPDRLEELQRRSAGATQARTLREFAEALEALSADTPVTVVLDDLHWTDPSTAELLAILTSRREPARLLVIGTYRTTEVARGHPLSRVVGELVAHRQASSLALEGLAAEAVEAFLARRFPGHRFPQELSLTLHRSTGGNPLFVATLVDDLESQRLIREGAQGWELSVSVADVAARRPDGVRRLIDTQIDRLSAVEQRILEVAGIAGATFTAGIVAHALDADPDEVDSACESLAGDRRLLQYMGTENWPDGTIQSRYTFGHTLFQCVALERSTAAIIRARHRKIAERIEAGYPARREEVADELAVHFERGQVPAKAAEYYVMAGERAARRYGLAEAVTHFQRARDLLANLPESRDRDRVELRALIGLAWRLFQREGTPDSAFPMLERVAVLAARLGDKSAIAEAHIRLETLCLVRGDLRGAAEHGTAAAPFHAELSDAGVRSLGQGIAATTVLLRGEFAEARRLLEAQGAFSTKDEERTVAEAVGGHLLAHSMAAFLSWLTGKPDQAVALVTRGYRGAERMDNPFERTATLSDGATVHAFRREPAKAAELARQSLALASQGEFPMWQIRAEVILRWAEAELTPDMPRERADELVGKPWEGGAMGGTMLATFFIAMCARLGRLDRGLDVAASMLDSIERTDERWLEPEFYRLRGELLRATDPAEAERAITKAVEIARKQSSLSLELRAALSLHALATGAKKKRTREDVARLLALFTEGRDSPDLVEARLVVERKG